MREIQGLLLASHMLQMGDYSTNLFHNANKAVFSTELILVTQCPRIVSWFCKKMDKIP